MSRKEFRNWFASALVAMLVVELCSWLSYSYPSIALYISAALITVVFCVACYDLLIGCAVVLAELTIGSQGHLLTQFRLGIFLAVFLASLIWMLWQRRVLFFETRYWKWYVALVAACAVAVVTGFWHGNDPRTIFLDANGYLFLGMIIPFTQAVRHKADIYKLLTVMSAGLTVLLVLTCLIAFAFSHQALFNYILPDLYRWLRDFRIVEITTIDYIRIFFQSHIFALYGLILVSLAFIRGYRRRWMAVLSGSLSTMLLISYSRSFWVATAVMVLVLAVLAKREWWKYLGMVALGSAIGYALVLGITSLKLGELAEIVSDRTTTVGTDAATSSRTALLTPLTKASLIHPLLGSGFGTTVTYCTSDVRIAGSEDCAPYTTFAFEWGYLDLWLKFGAVFAVLFCAVAVMIARTTWFSSSEIIPQAAALGIMAMLVVHAFTPYFNHPLGLGWLVFASVIGTVYSKQHVEKAA